ncbi:hypothetical protein [Thermomonospora amylolytica]|uniref:hypothetical protein n=1 Tax=Thermomonospora amylolytica TaxID=1411117 RepID=UPI001F24E938|nr:hypothetical protein [Thermomonospora amylolytica]
MLATDRSGIGEFRHPAPALNVVIVPVKEVPDQPHSEPEGQSARPAVVAEAGDVGNKVTAPTVDTASRTRLRVRHMGARSFHGCLSQTVAPQLDKVHSY